MPIIAIGGTGASAGVQLSLFHIERSIGCVGNSATEFAAFVHDDFQRWAPIVKQSGAGPD